MLLLFPLHPLLPNLTTDNSCRNHFPQIDFIQQEDQDHPAKEVLKTPYIYYLFRNHCSFPMSIKLLDLASNSSEGLRKEKKESFR